MLKPLDDQISSAKRELAMRKRVYPNWVAAQRMDQQTADHEILCMRAIIKSLEYYQNKVNAGLWPYE